MKRITRQRIEELFSAEQFMRRVYLHLMQKEQPDISALMLVVMRYEQICAEQRQLKSELKSELETTCLK